MSKTLNDIKVSITGACGQSGKRISDKAQIMACVAQLESFPMTRSLLEQTRIGRLVNDLRKLTDEVTSRRIKGLIRAWQPLMKHADANFAVVPGGLNGTQLTKRGSSNALIESGPGSPALSNISQSSQQSGSKRKQQAHVGEPPQKKTCLEQSTNGDSGIKMVIRKEQMTLSSSPSPPSIPPPRADIQPSRVSPETGTGSAVSSGAGSGEFKVRSSARPKKDTVDFVRPVGLADETRSLHSGSSAHTGTTRSRGRVLPRIPKVKSTAEILTNLDLEGVQRETYNQILNNEMEKEPDLPPVVPASAQPRRHRRRKDKFSPFNPLESTPDTVKQSKRDILNKFLASAASCQEGVLAPGEGENAGTDPAYEPITEECTREEVSADIAVDDGVRIRPNLLHKWPELPPLPSEQEVDWLSLDYEMSVDGKSTAEDRQNGLLLPDGRWTGWTDGYMIRTSRSDNEEQEEFLDVWPWVDLHVWPCRPQVFPEDALDRLEDGPEPVW